MSMLYLIYIVSCDFAMTENYHDNRAKKIGLS